MKRVGFVGCWIIMLVASGVSAGESASFSLSSFKLEGQPVAVPGVQDNLSGLTYSEATDTLFAVLNSPMKLVEMGKDGSVKRVVPLAGFHDTEGIAWIEDRRFAVLEERRRQLVVVDLPEGTQSVQHADCQVFPLLPPPQDNSGTEGVAYDPGSRKVFVVKEKKPMKVLSFTLPGADAAKVDIQDLWQAELKKWGVSDLAGLHFNRGAGGLLVLSDESKVILQVSSAGEVKDRLELKAGSAGLAADVGQPEGITVDKDGCLYIVSEPNLLYRFAPTRK